jgi:hypothetical protein
MAEAEKQRPSHTTVANHQESSLRIVCRLVYTFRDRDVIEMAKGWF